MATLTRYALEPNTIERSDRSDPTVPPKILVVEDEAITAEVIAVQLNRLGYFVVGTASTVADALTVLELVQVDLALVDINLGDDDLDGIDLATQIRYRFQLPVVYLTAYSDRATLERAKQAGPFGYILKPFRERDLQIAIENAISTFHLERQLSGQQNLVADILNATHDGILVLNRDSHIIFINRQAEGLIGCPAAQAFRQTLDDVIVMVDGRQDPICLSDLVTQVLETHRTTTLDNSVYLSSTEGTRLPVSVHVLPLGETQGGVAGILIVITNISERYQLKALKQEFLHYAPD